MILILLIITTIQCYSCARNWAPHLRGNFWLFSWGNTWHVVYHTTFDSGFARRDRAAKTITWDPCSGAYGVTFAYVWDASSLKTVEETRCQSLQRTSSREDNLTVSFVIDSLDLLQLMRILGNTFKYYCSQRQFAYTWWVTVDLWRLHITLRFVRLGAPPSVGACGGGGCCSMMALRCWNYDIANSSVVASEPAIDMTMMSNVWERICSLVFSKVEEATYSLSGIDLEASAYLDLPFLMVTGRAPPDAFSV
jgi:hypothetical protein